MVIAFGDLPAYKRALRMLVRTTHQLDEEIDLRPLPWQFDALADPASRVLAVADAQRAAIVIIAATRAAPLPDFVQQWVKACCQPRESAEPLLIGLLGPAHSAPSGVVSEAQQWLRSVALDAGWNFLSSYAERPEPSPAHPVPSLP